MLLFCPALLQGQLEVCMCMMCLAHPCCFSAVLSGNWCPERILCEWSLLLQSDSMGVFYMNFPSTVLVVPESKGILNLPFPATQAKLDLLGKSWENKKSLHAFPEIVFKNKLQSAHVPRCIGYLEFYPQTRICSLNVHAVLMFFVLRIRFTATNIIHLYTYRTTQVFMMKGGNPRQVATEVVFLTPSTDHQSPFCRSRAASLFVPLLRLDAPAGRSAKPAKSASDDSSTIQQFWRCTPTASRLVGP